MNTPSPNNTPGPLFNPHPPDWEAHDSGLRLAPDPLVRVEVRELTAEEVGLLNPGIRETVVTLRGWGFETCDSGDGSTAEHACDLPFPYVHIKVRAEELVSETDRLLTLLDGRGVNFSNPPHPQHDPEGSAKHPAMEASYLPTQGWAATIHLFNVVLGGSGEAGGRDAPGDGLGRDAPATGAGSGGLEEKGKI